MRAFVVEDTLKNAGSFPVELLSSTSLSHFLNCGKILHGRAKISRVGTNQSFVCKFNYSKLKATRDGISPKTFVREILAGEATYLQGIKILDALRRSNTGFFKALEAEIAHCIYAKLSGDYLLSFLHLYRSIEKISASFPLIYITGQSDFGQSIDSLREYFSGKGGELSFASKFSRHIANNSWIEGEYNIDFKTKISNIDAYNILLSEIKSCCPNFINDDADSSENGVFSVQFEKVPSFLIACRNRMFHYSNDGQRNFDLDRIDGPSELCRMLTESGLHWLALCYDGVISRQASRLVLA